MCYDNTCYQCEEIFDNSKLEPLKVVNSRGSLITGRYCEKCANVECATCHKTVKMNVVMKDYDHKTGEVRTECTDCTEKRYEAQGRTYCKVCGGSDQKMDYEVGSCVSCRDHDENERDYDDHNEDDDDRYIEPDRFISDFELEMKNGRDDDWELDSTESITEHEAYGRHDRG